eukprot:m.36720 g.36720  ORF g.36720 m.36720 type:complete len:587 (+) comp32270_c0_seq2:586-2346(+)
MRGNRPHKGKQTRKGKGKDGRGASGEGDPGALQQSSSSIAVVVILVILAIAAGLATFNKEDTSIEEQDQAPEVAEESDNDRLNEQFEEVVGKIDKDLQPSQPYEDLSDFDLSPAKKAIPRQEEEEEEEKPYHRESSEPMTKKPELKRVNWWPSVEEKLAEIKHETVHVDPNVYVLPDFLSTAECYELIKLYEKMKKSKLEAPRWCFRDPAWLEKELKKAGVNPQQVRFFNSNEGDVCVSGFNDVMEKMMYSSTVLVPRGEDPLVDKIERKIQDTLGLPLGNSYHAQLIKYRGNEEYRPHTDCHNDPNDRLGTVIIYLNDVKEGGHTEFPRLKNVSVAPKRGLGLLWNSLDKNGKCNKKTLHASGVLKQGVKYIFQRWFHQDPMVPSYDSEVVLCDNSKSCREYIYSSETRQATEKMIKAERFVSQKNLREALSLYQQAVNIQPNHSLSLIYGADVLMRIERKPEALRWFKRALKLHPQHVDSNFIAASILQDEGKFQQAVEMLRTVVEVAPNDGDAFFNLGIMLSEMEELQEAAKMLQKATEIKPDDAEAHGELGSILSDLGKNKEAEIHYTKAKEIMKKAKRRRQ